MTLSDDNITEFVKQMLSDMIETVEVFSTESENTSTVQENSDIRKCTRKRPYIQLINVNVLPEGSTNVRDFPRYMCPECLDQSEPKVFYASQLDNLKAHLRHKHRDKYISPFSCPSCAKPFPKKQSLNYHIRHNVCKPDTVFITEEVKSYRRTMELHDK